jgi:hypothetical protein
MSIKLLDKGFCISSKTGIKDILWNDVNELHAYKKDLLTYDEICINIILPKSIITITEEIEGWVEFIEKMNKVFPSINKEWYADIMLPAFKTNFTILYKKS